MTRQYDDSNTVDYRHTMKAHQQEAMTTRGWSLAATFASAFKAIFFGSQRGARKRHLEDMPDYLLEDMGIHRDQINAIISGSLKREPLALSPTGNQSAPAFSNARARSKKSANSNTGESLAA